MLIGYGKKEKGNITDLYSVISNDVLEERIKTCIEWYIEKASMYRVYFYIFSIISIVMPLIITIVNNGVVWSVDSSRARNVVTICSAIASLAASFLAFFKFQEKWLLYRSTAEEMKAELSQFQAGKLTDESEKQLILKLEEHMRKERTEWFLLNSESSGNQDGTQRKTDGEEDKQKKRETEKATEAETDAEKESGDKTGKEILIQDDTRTDDSDFQGEETDEERSK